MAGETGITAIYTLIIRPSCSAGRIVESPPPTVASDHEKIDSNSDSFIFYIFIRLLPTDDWAIPERFTRWCVKIKIRPSRNFLKIVT